MKWDAFFANGNYQQNDRAAKGEWRAQISGLANDEQFLNDLANEMGKPDGKEFNDAFEEIYELRSGDIDKRGDFLLQICIQCARKK
jgi:hypothetical protein